MNKAIKTPIRNFSFHSILKCQERFKISNGVKILIFSIAVFGAGFLAVLPVKAIEVDELVVKYSSDEGNTWLPFSAAIFSETNFLPGQDVTRLIRVINNSGGTQRIAVEAINQTNVGDLASQLDIIIKEGGTVIYNKTLKQFFDDKEIYLSSLAAGGQTQYKFNISFESSAGDDYQNKKAGFDLLVGFEGTEGGLTLPPQGGGGGGGGLPPGLTIQNQAVVVTTDVSVLITWTTSYPATSQVIYDTTPGKFNLNPATGGGPVNYGYAFSKEGDDIYGLGKDTSHQVTIVGLSPITTYYYRSVSHGSLAISTEHSFTTLGVKTEEEKPAEETVSNNEMPPKIISASAEGQTSAEQPAVSPSTPSDESTPTEAPFVSGAEPQIENNQVVGQQTEQPPKQSLFLAAISGIITLGTG
ncbi:fibronectin type III domain-containing protein, partial [Patescibacteria group bacterium]|nr:fibronectin type III domain-containing protein [Patescibacteria group bacterium]